MQQPPIAISLVTYNGSSWLPHCLASLASQTCQEFFLLIIDNSSLDDTVSMVEAWLAERPAFALRTRLIKNTKNLGFASGHNRAFAWSTGTYFFVLNQDVVLMPDYLEKLMAVMDSRPEAASVSGKLLQWPFDSATFHISTLSQLKDPVIDSVGLRIERTRRVTNIGQGEPSAKYPDTDPYQVFGVPATAALYRRSALREVANGDQVFDETFVSYKEDVDLSWRLQSLGFESWLAPGAVGYHDRSLSGSQADGYAKLAKMHSRFPNEFKLYSWSNHLGVLAKNDTWRDALRDAPWILWHEALKLAYLVVTAPMVLMKAIFRTAALMPRWLKDRPHDSIAQSRTRISLWLRGREHL